MDANDADGTTRGLDKQRFPGFVEGDRHVNGFCFVACGVQYGERATFSAVVTWYESQVLRWREVVVAYGRDWDG